MTTRVPPKPKSMTLIFVLKVQGEARVFLIAQIMPSTRQLRPLLPVPMGGTILVTPLRRLYACGLPNKELRRRIPYTPSLRASHCTTVSVLWLWTFIRGAPDPRPRHLVPLAPKPRLYAALECHQRASSVESHLYTGRGVKACQFQIKPRIKFRFGLRPEWHALAECKKSDFQLLFFLIHQIRSSKLSWVAESKVESNPHFLECGN